MNIVVGWGHKQIREQLILEGEIRENGNWKRSNHIEYIRFSKEFDEMITDFELQMYRNCWVLA